MIVDWLSPKFCPLNITCWWIPASANQFFHKKHTGSNHSVGFRSVQNIIKFFLSAICHRKMKQKLLSAANAINFIALTRQTGWLSPSTSCKVDFASEKLTMSPQWSSPTRKKDCKIKCIKPITIIWRFFLLNARTKSTLTSY